MTDSREARITEALGRNVLVQFPDSGPAVIERVASLLDAEVAAAVSEAQAEAGRALALAVQVITDTERRAESAEAELERLREGIRALADEWDRGDGPVMQKRHCAAELRALLATSPAATTGEGIVTPEGITPGGVAVCPECGRWGSGGGLCLNDFHDAAHTVPAPESSGEADK